MGAEAQAEEGAAEIEIRDGGSITLRKNSTRMGGHGSRGSRSPAFLVQPCH